MPFQAHLNKLGKLKGPQTASFFDFSRRFLPCPDNTRFEERDRERFEIERERERAREREREGGRGESEG